MSSEFVASKNSAQDFVNYYNSRKYEKIYPSEFVVRTFKSDFTELKFDRPKKNDIVIDVSCGYGRNLLFLCEQGYKAYGTEVAQELCDATKQRMQSFGYSPDILVGKNHNMPFENSFADYILAAYCIHHCDKGVVMQDNIKEYSRVLKDNAYLIASMIHKDSYFFKNSHREDDGTYVVSNDSFYNIVGCRMHPVGSVEEAVTLFSPYFEDFTFGEENNNFYGVSSHQYWMVCRKKPTT